MHIHAFAARGPGAALHPFDYELQELGPYEIDFEASHCGVCHSDIHLIDNHWNVSHYPLVPGHEIIGGQKSISGSLTGGRDVMRDMLAFATSHHIIARSGCSPEQT